MKEDEIKKKLKNMNCRGCSNRCSLDNPGCNRSKVFIDEAIEKLKKVNKNDEDD